MTPFTKILVPHDFSAHADRALGIAADLARRYEASVDVLHVHESQLQASADAFLLRHSEDLPGHGEALQSKLRGLAERLSADGALQVSTQVRTGHPASEIVSHAAKGGIDLIVMATHGRTGLAHVLMGSVAERVMRSAICPVLTVRAVPDPLVVPAS